MIDPKKYQPKEIKQLKLDRQLNLVRFSPCGKVLTAAGSDATIRRWDAADFSDLPPLLGHGGWVQGLGFAEGRLFSADSWGKVLCWSYADKEAKPIFAIDQAHDGWIRDLAVSPDGKRFATCGRDCKVRLWAAADGKKLLELPDHPDEVFRVAFHPDGKSLATGDLKGIVRHWDVGGAGVRVRELDAKVLYKLDRLQDTGGIRSLTFNREGTVLAAAGTTPKNGGNVQGVPTILLFDWASGKATHTLRVGIDGDAYVYEAHFHPAGFMMAVASGNPGVGKFYFHRPGDDQPFFLFTKMANCHSLAVHPDGQRLVVSATNGGSNGNGRGKGADYPGNWSPLHVWELPKTVE